MTACACTTGATDTVYVVFTVVRQGVVKDVRNGRNMQAACRNVGRDQDIDITTGEIFQNTQTLLLGHVTGQQADAMTIGSQVAPDVFTAVLGVGEDNRAIWPLFFQQRLQ